MPRHKVGVTTILAIALIVLIPSISIPRDTLIQQAAATPVHRTFWLRGNAFSNWNNTSPSPGPFISVVSGDLVTIMLISDEGAFHNWFLDFNDNLLVDSDETPTSSPDFNSKTTFLNHTFTPIIATNIPAASDWTYRCRFHATSMFGTFRVQTSSAPVASFVFTPVSPQVGQTVSFDSSASTPSTGATITTYSWNFGDGSQGSGATTAHTYSATGTFTVTLTITDSQSQTNSKSESITVTSPTNPYGPPGGNTPTWTSNLILVGGASAVVAVSAAAVYLARRKRVKK